MSEGQVVTWLELGWRSVRPLWVAAVAVDAAAGQAAVGSGGRPVSGAVECPRCELFSTCLASLGFCGHCYSRKPVDKTRTEEEPPAGQSSARPDAPEAPSTRPRLSGTLRAPRGATGP